MQHEIALLRQKKITEISPIGVGLSVATQMIKQKEKEDEDEAFVPESLGLQMKMAFDDAGIKVKGVKSGKLVIDKKDEKKVIAVLSKSLKKGSDAKKVVASQIKFEEVEDQVDPNPSTTASKLFSHVRKLMSK